MLIKTEYDLGISLSGIKGALFRFLVIQIPFIILACTHVISSQFAAFPAALACLILFIWYYKNEKESVKLFESDIFYAGLLTASMVGIMFYFA